MSDETKGRDIHFQGFAKLLWDELDTTISEDGRLLYHFDAIQQEAIRLAIAQRAYDLLFHAIQHSTPYQQNDRIIKYILSHIPDLTEWPSNADQSSTEPR